MREQRNVNPMRKGGVLRMSTATATKTLMSADEFYEFAHRPENDGRYFELVRGEVIELPPPTKIHGRVCANASFELATYVRARGFGYVVSNDSGILLERDPDTVRGPDVAVFEDAATFEELHPKYGETPPVLAVEVLSPDTKVNLLNSKIDDYLNNGVKLVWVVDPETRTVRVYLPGKQPVTLKSDLQLDGGDVLQGFHCKVADFFVLPGKPSTEVKG
jgi:Uma2 family endonuclease